MRTATVLCGVFPPNFSLRVPVKPRRRELFLFHRRVSGSEDALPTILCRYDLV